MLQSCVKKAFLSAAFAVTTLLGGVGSAQAAVYTGTWDPVYGATFEGLGWKGSASFFIPDACLAGSGWIENISGCSGGGMKVLGAEVSFYDVVNPGVVVETLTFDPVVTVYKMFVGDNKLMGVSTNFLGPVHATSAIAGGGTYYFDLKFLEAVTDNVQLIHTIGNTDPICAYTGVPAGCGFSESNPSMTLIPVAVPEPETYALMLAGLVAVGFIARRRRR